METETIVTDLFMGAYVTGRVEDGDLILTIGGQPNGTATLALCQSEALDLASWLNRHA